MLRLIQRRKPGPGAKLRGCGAILRQFPLGISAKASVELPGGAAAELTARHLAKCQQLAQQKALNMVSPGSNEIEGQTNNFVRREAKLRSWRRQFGVDRVVKERLR